MTAKGCVWAGLAAGREAVAAAEGSPADDVARLGIGLVADVVGILLSLGNDGVRRLLSSDEGRGNLTLGGAHARRLLHRRGRGDRLSLRVRKLVLSIGELLLGRRQAILEIDDLGKHRVDLGSELFEEDIDLSGIVAALGLGKRLSLNVGIHLSLFSTQGKGYLSAQPRLSARYRFHDGFAAKASFTQMEQYVHLLSSSPISLPTDLWVPVTKNIRPMRSYQYAVGGYYTGVEGWEFSLESYYKDMHNVLEYQDGATFFGSSGGWQEKVEMGRGRSFGLEILAQKTIGKTTGWLGYTIAKSDRQFKDGTVNNGERFPYKYDRRHNINLCVNHTLQVK